MAEDTPILPAHIEDTVRSIAELHAEHDRRASLYQRTIARLIENLGRPASVGIIVILICVWIGVNIFEQLVHVAQFDPAPFPICKGWWPQPPC